MSCAHPIPAVDYGLHRNKDGKLVHNIKLLDMRFKHFGYGLEELKQKYGDSLVLLPCGKCYSCAIDYSRMWASRIMLEAKEHAHNSFITLTYDEEHVPSDLRKRDIQLFIKKLRKALYPQKIRYFLCGERGEESAKRDGKGRPHFHAIIFGFDFPDKVPLQLSKSGNVIYRSSFLESIWTFGISSIGNLTPESAQYCAKYSVKRKVTGNDSGEFVLMSRRPGIGSSSYDVSIWDTGKVYVSGHTYKAPRYFEKLAEDNIYFIISKDEARERGKAICSEKFLYNLKREEDALVRANDIKVYNDSLKVRF